MRAWLVGVLLVLAVAYVLWARARLRQRLLESLVRAAAGDGARGRRAVVIRQVPALIGAVACVAAAAFAEQQWRAFWVRIPLCLLVIGAYAPFASALSPVWFGRVRKGPRDRMTQVGAPPDVAASIAAAGRPFAMVGSLVTLAAVLVLAWHHTRAG